jgi:hypothetical protein
MPPTSRHYRMLKSLAIFSLLVLAAFLLDFALSHAFSFLGQL